MNQGNTEECDRGVRPAKQPKRHCTRQKHQEDIHQAPLFDPGARGLIRAQCDQQPVAGRQRQGSIDLIEALVPARGGQFAAGFGNASYGG